jgi:hypothetical protein
MCIYITVWYGLCGGPAVRQCTAVRGSARQCAAVRTAVCDGSVHGSVRAVHAIVCGSALGSVRQSVRQCAAVRQCGSVR